MHNSNLESRNTVLTLRPETIERVSNFACANTRELNGLFNGMDLPIGRRSLADEGDLRWLLRNLGVRNSSHPNYARAQQLLIKLAQDTKAVKASDLKRLGVTKSNREAEHV